MRRRFTDRGAAFEKWVEKLYDELGKLNVRRDVRKLKGTKHGDVRSQFDVVYGLVSKTYVECKYHEEDGKVPLQDVSTFAAKLKLHGIPTRKGVMVTNTEYDTRARAYACKKGITLVDRDRLARMDWRRSHQIRAYVSRPPARFKRTLEDRIKAYERT